VLGFLSITVEDVAPLRTDFVGPVFGDRSLQLVDVPQRRRLRPVTTAVPRVLQAVVIARYCNTKTRPGTLARWYPNLWFRIGEWNVPLLDARRFTAVRVTPGFILLSHLLVRFGYKPVALYRRGTEHLLK